MARRKDRLSLTDVVPEAILAEYNPRESEFRSDVVGFLRGHGWLVFYTYDPRLSPPAEPDIRAYRPPRAACLELKSRTGSLSEGQKNALVVIRDSGVEAHALGPDGWNWFCERFR